MHTAKFHTSLVRATVLAVAAGIFALCIGLMPHISHAQSTPSASLTATIRAAIMADPRSRSLSASQIDSMVQVLAAKAQTQGLTAQDIAYQPNATGVPVPSAVGAVPAMADPCDGSTSCSIGRYVAGGIVGNPFYAALWILSLIAAFVFWHARKNIHLLSMPHPQADKDVPAIGGKA